MDSKVLKPVLIMTALGIGAALLFAFRNAPKKQVSIHPVQNNIPAPKPHAEVIFGDSYGGTPWELTDPYDPQTDYFEMGQW